MSVNSKVMVSIILTLIIAIIFYLSISFLNTEGLCESDPVTCPCLAILPDEKVLDFKYKIDDKGRTSEVIFGGKNKRTGATSIEIAEKFVQCLERVRPTIRIINYSRLDTSPLGQVAQQWSRINGMKINLRPQNDSESKKLNNLQVGSNSGLRWNLINQWCEHEAMACVQCAPHPADGKTVSVEIRLKANAPLIKEFWSSGWIVGQKNRDWELIDNKGDRFLFRCENNKSDNRTWQFTHHLYASPLNILLGDK